MPKVGSSTGNKWKNWAARHYPPLWWGPVRKRTSAHRETGNSGARELEKVFFLLPRNRYLATINPPWASRSFNICVIPQGRITMPTDPELIKSLSKDLVTLSSEHPETQKAVLQGLIK